MRHLWLFFATSVSLLAQQSATVSSVLNAASYTAAGLPNSGIAQGSIFTIFGANLGPAQLVSATYPLPASLSGTSAQVTVNGISVSPIPLYTSATQVAMVMPSSTPPGDGTITVSYNGQTSAPVPLQVVPAAFGLFSMNQAGTGPAVVTDTNYASVTVVHPASQGQTLVLWGTGLGKTAADETMRAPAGNIGDKPTVWVGSQAANVLYWGRSGCCSGLDQINFQVPANIAGCYVPVVVQTGSAVSNFGSIAVADNSGACPDPVVNVESRNITSLLLLRSTVMLDSPPPGVPAVTTTDSASASFLRYTSDQLISSSFSQTVSAGGCMVFPIYLARSVTAPNVVPGVIDPVQPVGLDAGSVELGGSNGSKTLTQSAKGMYSAMLGSSEGPPNLYLDPAAGVHTFNIFGGADAGPFFQELFMPAAAVWANQSSVSVVSKSAGVTLQWSNAEPNGNVLVTGYSFSSQAGTFSQAGARFYCTVVAGSDGAGQFTVPPYVLANLPASQNGFLGLSSLTIRHKTPAARGLDAGFAEGAIQMLKNVTYVP